MLIVFKSKAGSDVIYLGSNGQDMLRLIGKDPDEPRGVITVEQLPAAIAALQALVETDKAQAREAEKQAEADAEAGKPVAPPSVNLFQRAVPLLNLLMYSRDEAVPVTWGV